MPREIQVIRYPALGGKSKVLLKTRRMWVANLMYRLYPSVPKCKIAIIKRGNDGFWDTIKERY